MIFRILTNGFFLFFTADSQHTTSMVESKNQEWIVPFVWQIIPGMIFIGQKIFYW